MAEIGTEQASTAAAPAVTPGAQQGPVNRDGDLAEAMLAMSAKFDAVVGALPGGIAPATTGARESGQGGPA
jgi:adenine/guanine phosphoribosyltransferase-like PRPP-binding protein